MSNEEIYMSTKLAGPNTRFLPFNKGITNPEVKDDYNTSYLIMRYFKRTNCQD